MAEVEDIPGLVRQEFTRRLKPLMPPDRTWRTVRHGKELAALIDRVVEVLDAVALNFMEESTELLMELHKKVEKPTKSGHCGCPTHADPDFCIRICAELGCSDFGIDAVPEV
jgi:hypothetical protein